MNNNLIFIVDDDIDDIKSIHDSFLENKLQHEFMFFNNADQLLEHMSEIGRRGGQSSGGRRNRQQDNNTESSE